MRKAGLLWIAVFAVALPVLGLQPDTSPQARRRIERIHDRFVFVDMHAHPSRFHRSSVDRVTPEEIALYRRNLIDVAACNISTDAVYSGNYVDRDGTRTERGRYRPLPGEPFAFTLDRFAKILRTVEEGGALLALSPSDVTRAREQGRLALIAALEGADGLEGSIDNLLELHRRGLRLLQLVHFRANELGHIQTYPYSPGGLTEFGKEVVRECNRLGIVIDLAHANSETILDTLSLSAHPVIFSHTGAKALHEHDRYLSDEDVRAIGERGGVVGVWPNGDGIPRMPDMIRHIDHVKNLVGVDHVGIGSDLRGMSSYTEGFGSEGEFLSIVLGLLDHGYSDEEVGKVMGGNFFRVWERVSGNSRPSQP